MNHLSAIIALFVLGGAVPLQAANCKNWKGPSIWETASRSSVVECLEATARIEVRGKDERSPQHHATLYQRSGPNWPGGMRSSAKRGRDCRNPASRSSYRVSSLNDPRRNAAGAGLAWNPDSEVNQTLLTAGAEHSPKNRWGLTPLHFAAKRNWNADVAAIPALAGANAKVRADGGVTPLHLAARDNPNADVTRMLLVLNVYGSVQDRYGATALHFAASSNSGSDVVQVLLSAGADVNERDRQGYTPLDLASSSKRRSMIAVSKANSSPGPRPEYQADIAGAIMSGVLAGLESAAEVRSAPLPPPAPSGWPDAWRIQTSNQQQIEEGLRQQTQQRDTARAERARRARIQRRLDIQRANAQLLRRNCLCIGLRDGGGTCDWTGSWSATARR